MVHRKRSNRNEKPSTKLLLERSPLLAAPRASLCTARKTQHNLKQINTLKIKTNKQTKKPALSLRAQRIWRLRLTGPQTHKEIQRGKEKGGNHTNSNVTKHNKYRRSEKHRGRQPGAVCTQAQASQTQAPRTSGQKKKQNCKKSYQQRKERNEHRQTKNSPG